MPGRNGGRLVGFGNDGALVLKYGRRLTVDYPLRGSHRKAKVEGEGLAKLKPQAEPQP